MKALLKFLVILPFLLVCVCCMANDGAFRTNGNQLIPMYETDISVKKEILTIRRINTKQAQIMVYYEFFNPKEDKALEVGFEAFSPHGDADALPVDGAQPYITHFTVALNGGSVPFKVTIVSDSLYFRNGKFKSKSVAEAIKESKENEYVDFFYVYHFRALFKKGMNIIQHTYIVDLSNSIIENYSLEYVLTAAKRWANRQIDDFTLQIDMGAFQYLCIPATFFKNASEWTMGEKGKGIDLKANRSDKTETDTSEFFIRNGMLVFQKMNFKPAGELSMHSPSAYYYYDANHSDEDRENFNSRHQSLPFSLDIQDAIKPPANELSKRILRNLPFARRGYQFSAPELRNYYEHQKWYLPDSTYTPVSSELTKKERDWLKKLNL